MTINVMNKSTLISDTDVQAMTAACAVQVKECAKAWRRYTVPVRYVAATSQASPGDWVIAVLDDPDQANALGWHTEDQGELVYGRVFARPVLDNGGTALSGGRFTVSSVLSHEVLETLIDPNVNGWADSGRGFSVALEVCDPVESDSYDIAVGALGGVTVSNYVTPHWFDPQSDPGHPFDRLGTVKAPFTMSPGGYWVQQHEGAITQKFGAQFPDWKRPGKRADTSRAARRT